MDTENAMQAYELALSTCSDERLLTDEGMQSLRAAGVKAIEISFGREATERIDFEALCGRLQAHGLRAWSLHLPFDGADVAALDEALRGDTLALYGRLIARAGAAGVRTAVIHPCLEPVAQADRPARMQQAKRSLRELAEWAEAAGVVLAVEDLPRSCLGNCAQELLELLSADERLRICFDTNHLLLERWQDALPRLKGKIRTVHLSDYDFVDERHWLPGEGKLDWRSLLHALRGVGYHGPLLYEVGLGAPRHSARTHPRTLQEFSLNYRMLRALMEDAQ